MRDKGGSSTELEFQKLLLHISEAAGEGLSANPLIRLFCAVTREFFQVDGVYFWHLASSEELVCMEGVGDRAKHLLDGRLRFLSHPGVAAALAQRQVIYANNLSRNSATAPGFGAASAMVAPLVVSNQVIGALVLLHDSDPDHFNDEMSVRIGILVLQLGSLLETDHAPTKPEVAHRHTGTLVNAAKAMDASDPKTVFAALASQLRELVQAPVVCVLLRDGNDFDLFAVAAEFPDAAASFRSRHNRTSQFTAEIARHSLASREPIMVAIDPASHALGDLVSPGLLIAAPFRTSQTEGAVLVYPREQGVFTSKEKSLTSAIAGLGAVTISNSELSSLTRSRSQELHQLLQIICDLDRGDHPEDRMQQFVDAVSQFLGFERVVVGTLEEAGFEVRWHHGGNTGGRLNAVLANEIVSQALLTKEVFWTDNRAGASGPAAEVITKFQIRQLLAVPLLGTDGEVIGVFGALDRSDGLDISQEDIRRARALAAQAATWLRMSHHVTVSDQYRARAESLMALAQELSSLLRLPDFGKGFVNRAAKMLGATAGALTVKQDSGLETVILQSLGGEGEPERSLLGEFDRAIAEVLTRHPQPIVGGNAGELLGTKLAQSLGWTDCTLVRLSGITSELVGVLALAGRGKELGAADRQLIQAIAGNASVALENAQFFTRMEQANRHWMEIFDAIGDFIVAHDEAGRVLRVNRSLADFIGVQPNELVGVNMSALLALGEDSLLRSCPFCRSTGEAAGEYVHPVLERTFLVSTSRVHGASSEILQTIHVLKDISDRREAERRYRELFDNIQEGLFFSTPDGRFIEVNDALVRMLGYSSREELLHVDVRSEMYSSPERHLELSAHMLQHGALRNHEEVLRRKDGNPVHVLINAFAVCDTHGRVIQYRGLMLDITGLKSSQSQLLLERDFSEKIVNNTQSLILVADIDGLVTYANRRWYDMGYEQKRILGQRLDGLVVASRRGVLNEAFTAILKGNQVDNLDLQILRGDGRVGHFSVNLSPMRDEAGNVTSIVVVMSDITDAATLQAKLMHAEKMAAVGQLVSGVAHEVNNPLTAILGFADLLMENTEVPESARKDLRVILQEAQRTKQIVQNLLSFARQMPPQRKPVQLNMILRRTVQLRAYDFHSRGVEVIQQFDQDLPNVIGDSHQLQQVFLNIVNNAYDAVREAMRPARIEITTEARGNFVEISFRDNGNGITFPDRIFDPFFTTKEVGKGTGLGLSICYGIVREHGGEVLCHNNVEGEGATFIVRLPVATELASIGAAAGVTQP